MASISTAANGTRRILFVDGDGLRKAIRIGAMPKKDAAALRVKVESLLASRISGQPVEPETARWVAGVGDTLHGKLAAVGLVEPRATAKLGAFIDAYIKRRSVSLKAWSVTNLQAARRYLVTHLGEDRDLRNITPADAEDWRDKLLADGLAENTVRRATGRARQFFAAAIKRGLIDSNPFADLAASVRPERSRDYFVSREEAAAVLDACPDAEWRAMFALARYGGLRTPSETLRLRWSDIDWAGNRFTVHASKTEHHTGGGVRIVPLFPELLPHLQAAFEAAPDGAEFVITRYRDVSVNLRTQLQRIIKRAGLASWPKLWQNLRATRATELAQQFPQHVAAAWLGHSAKVAADHYLQVTGAHFEAAIQHTETTPVEAARNAAQNTPARGRTEPQAPKKNRTQTQGTASECGGMPVTGFEPVLR